MVPTGMIETGWRKQEGINKSEKDWRASDLVETMEIEIGECLRDQIQMINI